MKKITVILLVLYLLFNLQGVCYAEDVVNDLVSEQIGQINFNSIDEILEEHPHMEMIQEKGVKDLLIKMLKGESVFTFKSFSKELLQIIFKEVRAESFLLGQIIIIAILSQVIMNLSSAFKKSAVSEIGFFIVYITLVMLIFKSFGLVMTLVTDTVEELSIIIHSILPTLMTFVLASGQYTSGTAIYGLMIGGLDVLTAIIKNFVIYVIYGCALLELANYISRQQALSHLIGYMKKIISKSLKIMIGIFVTIMGINSLTAPMVDGVIKKAGKAAVNGIPVIGGALSGVIDTVLSCSLLIKNTVGILGVILIFLVCLIPIIKVAIIVFLYKLSASFLQPVADKRIIGMLSGIGDHCSLLLGVMVTVMIIFICAIAILVGSTNITMMMG